MSYLTISPDHRHFCRDGKPFFWLGDTVWSAFTNAEEAEWAEYLALRKKQGFNVLQINTLPQWDRIFPDLGLAPYPVIDGHPDYLAEPDPAWGAHAQKLCAMARDAGFMLALVVDWCGMVPDTWLSAILPARVCSPEELETHVRRVVQLYGAYDPVYIVSGDTNFGSAQTAAYYRRTIDLLRTLAPDALLTMHLSGELTDIPGHLADSLDFLMVQTGHHGISMVKRLVQEMLTKYPGKPLLNAEPCYENMPVFHGTWDVLPTDYYSACQVLTACRDSLSAGAEAGITYGANGVWNWRRSGDQFSCPQMYWKRYSNTLTWRQAMQLPGAGLMASLKPD